MTEGSLSQSLLPASRRTVPIARLAACAFFLLGLASLFVFQISRPTPSAQPHQVGLRAELMLRRKSELAAMAKKAGVPDEAIHGALDADDTRSALVSLIMAREVVGESSQVSPVASAANHSHLRPLDLVSEWGDSQCWLYTGGTCTIQGCDSWRQATCAWASSRCWCKNGCVDAKGGCQSKPSVKVQSGFKLRNVHDKSLILSAPRMGLLHNWHMLVEEEGEATYGLDQFALWKQPGVNSNNDTSYFLSLDNDPEAIVGLPGLQMSKVFACMRQQGPGTDPAQLQVQPCRPSENPHYVEFHYQDVVMRLGHLFSCAEGWAHAAEFDDWGWWIPEPQLDIPLPTCTKSWLHYGFKYTVEQGKKAYDALLSNAGLMHCLQTMPKKWTLNGLMDDVIQYGVNPAMAPTLLFNQYLKPMADSLIGLMHATGGQCSSSDSASMAGFPTPAPAPAPEDLTRARRVRRRLKGDEDYGGGNGEDGAADGEEDEFQKQYDDKEHAKCHPDGLKCESDKYRSNLHSSCMCLLGCWVDLSKKNWPEQIPQPILNAINNLADKNAWGPLGCLMLHIVDPGLSALITLMGDTIRKMLKPVQALGHQMVQYLPYHDICYPEKKKDSDDDEDDDGDGDGGGDEEGGSDGDGEGQEGDDGDEGDGGSEEDMEGDGDGAAAKKRRRGRRLQVSSVDVAQFFGGEQIGKFLSDATAIFTDKIPCIVKMTLETECLGQMKKQAKKGPLSLDKMDAAALFTASIPKILHTVLQDYLLGDFMGNVVKPALDFFKGKISMLFTNGAQAVTGVAGLLPEVGGLSAMPVMATIGSGFMMIITHVGDFLFGYIRCVLSTLFEQAMDVVKKAIKPAENWLEDAKQKVIAWLKEKYQYLVPVMNSVFDSVIPLIAMTAGPKLHDCLTYVYEASGGCPDEGQCRPGAECDPEKDPDCDPDDPCPDGPDEDKDGELINNKVKCCLPANTIVWGNATAPAPPPPSGDCDDKYVCCADLGKDEGGTKNSDPCEKMLKADKKINGDNADATKDAKPSKGKKDKAPKGEEPPPSDAQPDEPDQPDDDGGGDGDQPEDAQPDDDGDGDGDADPSEEGPEKSLV